MCFSRLLTLWCRRPGQERDRDLVLLRKQVVETLATRATLREENAVLVAEAKARALECAARDREIAAANATAAQVRTVRAPC